MANSTGTAIRYEYHTLSQKDVQRLMKENSLVVLSKENFLVLKGTPFLSRILTDPKTGEIVKTSKGEPVRALYTVALVKHLDGTFSAGRVTLSFLSGEDVYVDSKCPLLPCKDGIRKYAATWQCEKMTTRNFTLHLAAGDDSMPYDLITVAAGEPIEGYREPSLTDVWIETTLADGTKKWINKEGLGEELELKPIRRYPLQVTQMKLTDTERKICEKLIKEAIESLRVVERLS